MPHFPLHGGCHCGAVRYTVSGPALGVEHCHCQRCRKLYASLYGTYAVIERTKFAIAGVENLTSYRSSPGMASHFCKVCGCRLFAIEEREPGIIYYTAATLDGGAHPGHPAETEAHVFVDSKAPWERMEGTLPRFEEASPG